MARPGPLTITFVDAVAASATALLGLYKNDVREIAAKLHLGASYHPTSSQFIAEFYMMWSEWTQCTHNTPLPLCPVDQNAIPNVDNPSGRVRPISTTDAVVFAACAYRLCSQGRPTFQDIQEVLALFIPRVEFVHILCVARGMGGSEAWVSKMSPTVTDLIRVDLIGVGGSFFTEWYVEGAADRSRQEETLVDFFLEWTISVYICNITPMATGVSYSVSFMTYGNLKGSDLLGRLLCVEERIQQWVRTMDSSKEICWNNLRLEIGGTPLRELFDKRRAPAPRSLVELRQKCVNAKLGSNFMATDGTDQVYIEVALPIPTPPPGCCKMFFKGVVSDFKQSLLTTYECPEPTVGEFKVLEHKRFQSGWFCRMIFRVTWDRRTELLVQHASGKAACAFVQLGEAAAEAALHKTKPPGF